VSTSTGEEYETISFNERSKMYIFYKEDKYGDEVRKNLWKERGKGQLKILQHKTTGKYRLLMRQEATKKVICNAPITGQETSTYPTPKQVVSPPPPPPLLSSWLYSALHSILLFFVFCSFALLLFCSFSISPDNDNIRL
jgi:hypothetical protein